VEVKPAPAIPGVVVGEELVDVGPGVKSLAAGEFPNRAASMAGSFPSMPSAQIPTPRMWKALASSAFMAIEVGSSKYVSCHWEPTW
jgi:hypothetical protein